MDLIVEQVQRDRFSKAYKRSCLSSEAVFNVKAFDCMFEAEIKR